MHPRRGGAISRVPKRTTPPKRSIIARRRCVSNWALKSPAGICLHNLGQVSCNELGQCRVASLPATRFDGAMRALTRPTKITFAEMRTAGVRGVLIYCSDYKCSHSTAISADQWPDHVRLSDLEARFVCKACGKRGADVRPIGSTI
jgi:hypothetical protein